MEAFADIDNLVYDVALGRSVLRIFLVFSWLDVNQLVRQKFTRKKSHLIPPELPKWVVPSAALLISMVQM